MSNNTSFENDVAYDPDMVRAMNLSRAQALAQKQNHQQHLIVNMSRYVLHNAAKTFFKSSDPRKIFDRFFTKNERIQMELLLFVKIVRINADGSLN